MTEERFRVKRGASTKKDVIEAVEELKQAIYQSDAKLTVFYCGRDYDIEQLGKAMVEAFGDQIVVGCTSAGEIGPRGYTAGGLTGVSLASEEISVLTRRLDNVSAARMGDGQALAEAMLAEVDPSYSGSTD